MTGRRALAVHCATDPRRGPAGWFRCTDLCLAGVILLGVTLACGDLRAKPVPCTTGPASERSPQDDPQSRAPVGTLSADAGDGTESDALPPLPRSDPRVDAEAALPAFLDAAWKLRSDYGFADDDPRSAVTLGQPFEVFSLDQELAARVEAGATLVQALQPAGEWIFPVQVHGQTRTLFGLRPSGDHWRGVYLGNPVLASALEQICAAHADRSPLLLSSLEPRAFFFTVPQSAPQNLTPITDLTLVGGAALSAPGDWRQLQPASEVLAHLETQWNASDP